MGKASPIFLILLTIGFFIATYNLVILVIHDQNLEKKTVKLSLDPVIEMPQALKRAMGPKRPFHVALTATDAPYSKWQCRIMYYWYKRTKEMEGSEMGGFTRILHSGNPDELVNEMPTFIAEPLPPGMDRGYIVLNRPWAFVQWIEKANIEEDYVLMAEPDHIFVNPLPNLARENYPAAFPFFYIKPTENEKIIRKFYPEEKGPVSDVDPIGNSPVIILKEEVYMEQPYGFTEGDSEQLVCKLNKALYGLKQAPRVWFEKLKTTLCRHNYHQTKSDNSLFIKFFNHTITYILIYVDDFIITGNSKSEIDNITQCLKEEFSIKDLGELHYFLGIEVKRISDSEIHLNQKKYINDILVKAKMDKGNPLPTPMTSNLHLSKNKGDPILNDKQYRSIVGALQYATITRPDIVYSVNKVSQFMQCPLDEHWKAVKRILRYLKGSINQGLTLQSCSSLHITGYCDSDWATDHDDRKSTTGYCVFLGNNLISWCAKKQQTVSRSSTEAEYPSIASTTAENMWIKSLLSELHIRFNSRATIWCDNQSAISLTVNPVLHSRMKHIELDLYFVREQVIKGELKVNYVPSTYQKADILTKPLSRQSFTCFRHEINVDEADSNLRSKTQIYIPPPTIDVYYDRQCNSTPKTSSLNPSAGSNMP